MQVVGVRHRYQLVRRAVDDQHRAADPRDPLADDIAAVREETTALVGTAVVVAVAANLLNNWPAALLAVSVFATDRLGGATNAAAYDAISGAGIGAKFTMIGSLATVLWLALVRQRGRDLSPLRYTRVALAVTPVALGAAVVAAVALLKRVQGDTFHVSSVYRRPRVRQHDSERGPLNPFIGGC